jgi:low affinity Fe/Cu permease
VFIALALILVSIAGSLSNFWQMGINSSMTVMTTGENVRLC